MPKQELKTAGGREDPSVPSPLAATRNLSPKEVFELISDDLAKVEEEFGRQSISSVEPITEISRYLQRSGGKRIRPVLVLLSSRFCGFTGPAAIRLGAVVEIIHTATLVHDDIIDMADLRRGRPSTNSRWGNHMSVLAGDWLYMQSFQLALGERNFKILDSLINLTRVMVEGELIQLNHLGSIRVTEEQYLELCYRKTACLFSACMRLGALAAGVNSDAEERVSTYGTHLGMAFQLIDDLLDFTSSEKKLGKPVGNDLREGKLTLPLIYLLQACRPEEAKKVAQVLEDQSFSRVSLSAILALMERYDTLGATCEKARQYAAEAKAALAAFPDSIYKDALSSLADFIVARET